MKKIIFRRKRLVLNDDASTHHDTAVPKSPECVKLRHEQDVQDHEDDASNHTTPTEVNMSTDVLSVDPLTGAGELTLAQYLQQQADCGSDKTIIDKQDRADDVLDDPDLNEERSSDKYDMVDREVKKEASIMNANIEYSGDLDNIEITDEVDSVENSRDCDDDSNRGSDYHGEIEDERSENEMQTKEKKQQATSWFDSAIDNAVNDVAAAIDDDFVEDMLGVANQAAIVILKSVRKAIHSIDEVLSGCLEDEDDDESNKEGNDEDEEEEEDDEGVNSTDLHFLAAHNYDETTGKSMNDPIVINPEKDVSTGWKKSKTKLKSFVKLRRVKSVKANFDC